jgi:hypothetical protein
MKIYSESLSRTIDVANDALIAGRAIPVNERGELVEWLLKRQVASGRNVGAFAPTAEDLAHGARLFTGEPLRTKLSTWNVLTAEAARLLILLGGDHDRVREAIDRAASWLDVSCFVASDCVVGECAHSFVSHLRFCSAAEVGPAVLVRRLNVVREQRDGAGRWRRFPFYYTVLALSEIPGEAAKSELRYAVPACERVLSRGAKDVVYGARRKALVERVIALDDLRLL